jgi:hypothetical protein
VCVEVSECISTQRDAARRDATRRGVAADPAARPRRRHLAVRVIFPVTVTSTHLQCLWPSNTCTSAGKGNLFTTVVKLFVLKVRKSSFTVQKIIRFENFHFTPRSFDFYF